ncbi:hypothetical protein FOZ63_022519 [Perkinsus olseni]|uniref:Mei2-like C-terminal RNA recognition motif domain-containing protein n=1 Tax=Perkinsus olseni TaxID=32597 RepID=A0A7J6RLT7_PEROL|nr:hypothetical protein FOZ63_022519 [Perkinsus olseni]
MLVRLLNVPSRYTQGELMQEISFAGFVGKFDFFYLPLDRVSMANADNCFINFTTAEDASEFFDFFAVSGWPHQLVWSIQYEYAFRVGSSVG